jgi:hypothetical protein
MIDEATRTHIAGRLLEVAAEEGVRILYAGESGSRAWGFPSPDSDYDVRFIYAHPRDWYLRLSPGRDVIERPLDGHLVDLAGWDVRKALGLLLKSNSALYEWLVSPIVYVEDGDFRARARDLFERHASPRTLAGHYASIAQSQWKRTLDGRETVRVKRYFYVLRPLLSLEWVLRRATPPPMAIGDLVAGGAIEADVAATIGALIQRKRTTPELGDGPRIAILDRWIAERLATLDPALAGGNEREGGATHVEADELFLRAIDA